MSSNPKLTRLNFDIKNKIFQIYNDGILRAPRRGGQHIYIIYHGTIFEQILFLVNFVVAISFGIYSFVDPSFVGAKTTNLAYIIAAISLVGNITDIMSIILSSKKRISTFAGGIIACGTLGVTSFLTGAVGTGIVYAIVQLPMQFVGFYIGRHQSVNKIQVKPRQMKGGMILLIIGVVLSCTTGFYFIEKLPGFQEFGNGTFPETNQTLLFDDSLILVLGTTGMILMVLAFKEQGIIGIILDICLLVLFSINLNSQMIGLAVTSIINGIYGVGNWRKDSKLKDYE